MLKDIISDQCSTSIPYLFTVGVSCDCMVYITTCFCFLMGVSSSSSVTDADGSVNVDTDEHTVVHDSSDNRNTVYSLLLS